MIILNNTHSMSDKKKRSVVKTRTVTKKDGTKIVSKSKTVINKKGNTITRSKVKTRTKGGGGSTVKSSSADLKNPRRNTSKKKKMSNTCSVKKHFQLSFMAKLCSHIRCHRFEECVNILLTRIYDNGVWKLWRIGFQRC